MSGNPNVRRSSALRIAMPAVMIAIYVVLDIFSIYVSTFIKLSFSALPLLLTAMIFGPGEAVIVAALGEFIYQLIFYGLMFTTPLWMLPPIIHALLAGIIAKHYSYKITISRAAAITLISGIIAAIFTTGVIYIDSQIWAYPSGLTAIAIIFRFITALIMCAIYTLLTPQIVKLLKRSIEYKIA